MKWTLHRVAKGFFIISKASKKGGIYSILDNKQIQVGHMLHLMRLQKLHYVDANNQMKVPFISVWDLLLVVVVWFFGGRGRQEGVISDF